MDLLEVVHIPSHVAETREASVAIDMGATLVKAVYMAEIDNGATGESSGAKKRYVAHAKLCHNDELTLVLAWLKEHCVLTPNDTVRVMGVKGEHNLRLIGDTLGATTEYVDEFVAQRCGIEIVIASDSDVYYHNYQAAPGLAFGGPPPSASVEGDVKASEGSDGTPGDKGCGKAGEGVGKPGESAALPPPPAAIAKPGEGLHGTVPDAAEDVWKETYPFLAAYAGSASPVLLFDGHNKPRFVGGSWMAGKTFLSLAKLLLDTDDFDEIMALAGKGVRSNLDTMSDELMKNEEALPPDAKHIFKTVMPLYAFGKLANDATVPVTIRREDLARSLCALVAENLAAVFSAVDGLSPRILVTGTLFTHRMLRDDLLRVTGRGPAHKRRVSVRFLRVPQVAAIGAMLMKRADNEFTGE